MMIFIYISDLGLTRHRGQHFWQTAILSPDCRGLTSLRGRMRVDGMGVTLCGALRMMRERLSVGWWMNLRKL